LFSDRNAAVHNGRTKFARRTIVLHRYHTREAILGAVSWAAETPTADVKGIDLAIAELPDPS
jgi:hypothetical protein